MTWSGFSLNVIVDESVQLQVEPKMLCCVFRCMYTSAVSYYKMIAHALGWHEFRLGQNQQYCLTVWHPLLYGYGHMISYYTCKKKPSHFPIKNAISAFSIIIMQSSFDDKLESNRTKVKTTVPLHACWMMS